ncbi:MAG: thiamine-phosphate kinase [Bacteroidetes bacterium]|nr:thiamine-phosphate kinase [Bacteroidota bacterium]
MKLGDIGEFGLIEEIKKTQKKFSEMNFTGIGDDCAIFPSKEGFSYVVTTDMLVEGKHFLIDKINPKDLGYKSLAVSVSDVASMGAKAMFSFLSISINKNTSTQWINDFLTGYNSMNIPLLGGDTCSGEEGNMCINVTVIGECENTNIKYRSSAKVGDIVAVTSPLGASATGLQAILKNLPNYDESIKAHVHPYIFEKESVWLGTKNEVHAMMDISDGVSSDLRHICKQSKCGAVINIDDILTTQETKTLCNNLNINSQELALSGGEDYALLLTISSDAFNKINKEYKALFNSELYSIGTINSDNKITYLSENKVTDINRGFTHF